MNVLVRALIKSHVPRPHIKKSGGKQKNCRATVSPILHCLCW